MQPFWNFLRRMTRDSILAGVEEAVRYLEQYQPTDKQINLAEQLNQRLQRLGQEKLPPPSGAHHPPRTTESQSHSPPPTSSTPAANHSNDKNKKELPPRKRGPGRPRKEDGTDVDRT